MRNIINTQNILCLLKYFVRTGNPFQVKSFPLWKEESTRKSHKETRVRKEEVASWYDNVEVVVVVCTSYGEKVSKIMFSKIMFSMGPRSTSK